MYVVMTIQETNYSSIGQLYVTNMYRFNLSSNKKLIKMRLIKHNNLISFEMKTNPGKKHPFLKLNVEFTLTANRLCQHSPSQCQLIDSVNTFPRRALNAPRARRGKVFT